jgi:hypothetical protein
VTDARLHSDKPIDDEVPFEDPQNVRRDDAPEEDETLVSPAAAERDRTAPDPDVEPSTPPTDVEG